MKKKRSIIIIVITILIIISAIIITLAIRKTGKNNQELVKTANTTKEQRILWNDFLGANPYLSQIETILESYISATDLIKLAITSNNVETESIVTEEIEENVLLGLGDGYKKSKDNINKYLKNILDKEDVAYNFVDTYSKQGSYLMIGEDYVYFTKIEIPEKIYIAVNYKEENGNYEVQIYEYDLTEENKENLTSMLETGEINEKIAIANKYTLVGQIEYGNIKIISKTSL